MISPPLLGHHSGRATPSLRATPTRAHHIGNRQRLTYPAAKSAQTKPASSVARLHEELNRPELREVAAAAIRGLIEEVRLVPVEGQLELELVGALAGILALTSNNPRREGQGLQVTLVAGARNLLYRTRTEWRRCIKRPLLQPVV